MKAKTKRKAKDRNKELKGNELIDYLVKRFKMTRHQAIASCLARGLYYPFEK
jgi:hypothetical protein